MSRFRLGTLVILMIMPLAATYAGGRANGLDRVVPERHRLYGIPIAISKDMYGLDGYVAYSAIARRFFNDKSIETILTQDLPKIPYGKTVADVVDTREALFFVPADDKGDVTFARMAFAMFGLKLDSLYKLYFLLLLGSVVAFILVFHSEAPKLFLGVCVMLSVFALPSAFQDGLLRPHVVTFYDVRIYGAIAMLAGLHLVFSCENGSEQSWIRVAATLYQIFVIILAVHVRSANMWLVCAVLVYVVVSVLRHVTGRASSTWPVGFVRSVWPLAALVAAIGMFLSWERVTYNSQYFSTNLSHHLFWHNAALGLALHPDLGRPYDFQISDEAMMKRVARYLLATHSTEKITRIFGDAYSNGDGTQAGVRVDVGAFLNSASSDLRLYNETARQIMFETVRTHPLQTAALFLYFKPRYILSHLLWFTAFLTYDQPSVDAAGHQSPLWMPGGKRTRRIYFTPLPAPGLVIFALALAVVWPLSVREARTFMIVALWFFAFSLLPSLVAYPAPFLMGEALVTLTLSLYLGLTMAVVAMSRIPRGRRGDLGRDGEGAGRISRPAGLGRSNIQLIAKMCRLSTFT